MRAIALLPVAALAASCATPNEPTTRSAEGQRQYEQLIAGKTAGPPLVCIPTNSTDDLRIIDGHTVAYRLGSKTTYVVHLSGGCGNLANGSYALVTEHFGGSGPCRGDAARVLDAPSRMIVGSCMIQEIVPYSGPA
jgi:hypothetical protein